MIVFLHNDLDACGCQMCIEERKFKVDKYFYTNYRDLEEKVSEIIEFSKENNIDELMIADLSFSERKDLLELLFHYFKRVVHIDHHQYDTLFFNKLNIPSSCKYQAKISSNFCASKLCYDLFKLESKYLGALMSIIDVYDRWLIDSKMFQKSQNLNKYFWKVGLEKFKENFKNSVPNDYKEVIEKILILESKEIEKLEKEEKIIRLENKKITIIKDKKNFNPIMINEMNRNQNVIIGVFDNRLHLRFNKKTLTDSCVKFVKHYIRENLGGHLHAFSYEVEDFGNETLLRESSKIYELIEEFEEIPF